MTRSYRLRRRFASTAGFWKAVAILTLGFVIFLIGLALSSKVVLQPALESLSRAANHVVERVVPQADLEESTHLMAGGLLFIGFYLMFLGTRGVLRRFMETINPQLKTGIAERFRRQQQLAQGPRIVCLGGGTGLSTLLRGLKQHTSNITAIVTVSDDGGSSGRLVAETGIIPPGDIRNCLVALADAEKAMTDLFQYRFKEEAGSLSGHSVGNLLIAALVDQARGDFEEAIEIASDVLAIRGRVVPSTLDHVRLRAVMDDGEEIYGETKIVDSGKRIRRVFLEPSESTPHQSALQAIKDADLIVIGPGSVYTSVIPNLLVPAVAETLHEAVAPKVYVCNVMTQRGESDQFTASEHLTALVSNVDYKVCDYVMVNTATPTELAMNRYREAGQFYVEPDTDRIRAMGYRVLTGNFMNESDLVRHDPLRIAARLMNLLK